MSAPLMVDGCPGCGRIVGVHSGRFQDRATGVVYHTQCFLSALHGAPTRSTGFRAVVTAAPVPERVPVARATAQAATHPAWHGTHAP